MRNIKGRNLQMEEKLSDLYLECALELEKIGINIQNAKEIGDIDVSISKRNNKRYGACKQEDPDKSTMYVEKIRKT